MIQHSTLVSTAALIVNALESYGVDPQAIIAEAGFDVDKDYAPTERVPTDKLKALWELCERHSGDPCFGLTYARYIQPAALHGLGFSWLASHTLKEGLERLVRYQRIISTELKLRLSETDDGYALVDEIDPEQELYPFPDSAYDAMLAGIYNICRMMMGPAVTPLRITFKHPRPTQPACAQQFDQFFGLPVSFEARENAIVFSRDDCQQPAPAGNPELARINDQVVIDYLNQFDTQDIVTRTRSTIIDHLPSGVPRQAAIAGDLGLSLRNFQRKLAQADTNYADLLAQVRHEIARQYLRSPQHQIITIAYLLGYSDPSNFARAFKSWDGQSPKEFRQKNSGAS